jgi:hypothetical protein
MTAVPKVPARPGGPTGTPPARDAASAIRARRGARGSLPVDYRDGLALCPKPWAIDVSPAS